jgi:hypothetical protein
MGSFMVSFLGSMSVKKVGRGRQQRRAGDIVA